MRINNLETTAELFGISRNTLSNWIRQGAPVLQHADRSRGQEWQLDFAAILHWREDRVAADAVANLQTDDGTISKAEADRRKAVAEAIVAEVHADEALKSVVAREDADELKDDFLGAIREALAPLPKIIGEAASHLTEPYKIREFIETEVNRAYRAAETALAAKWAE